MTGLVSQFSGAFVSIPAIFSRAHCCLLAGGVGGRLAPISTPERPKQFCDLTGQGPMIAVTADRFAGLVARDRIHVATNRAFESAVKENLPWISPRNITLEPIGKNKNTGPAVAVFAARLAAMDPDAVGIVTPSDHWIGDVPAFRKNVGEGILSAAQSGAVVAFGIPPSRPEKGFGYIRKGRAVDGSPAMMATEFIQKPDFPQLLIETGDYLWNSGMYVFHAASFRGVLAKYSPDLLYSVDIYLDLLRKGRTKAADEFYMAEMPRISIDHAVMESAALFGDMSLIPLESEWSDIGVWEGIRSLYASGKINPPSMVLNELAKIYPNQFPSTGISPFLGIS